jgi:hypothetical protein
LTFAVGDYVIYSGSIWQRSSGAVGTVTSVALTVGGDAISVSGSPLTTSGTLALAFSGTTSQYIRGNGTLANFPTSLVSGSGTANRLTKWSSTSGEIINSNILDTGITITNLNATADFFSCQFNGNPTTGRSYGVLIAAGSNSSDIAFRIEDVSSSSVYFYVWGDGRVQINNIPNATTDTDRFLVSDSGVIKYRTGAELLSDIGGASASGYVPYTGATANLDLGTHTLIAAKGTFSSSGSGDTVGITHSSGSGIALNITKGGNGEGLYINKTSGSGNAATIIGTLNATTLVKSGGTSSQFLKADGSVDSTSYGTGTVTSVGLSSATSGVTIGSTPITTSGTITLAIATASGSQQGLLSSTDWTTFNSKQNALTNPVTGTGTTNYLPKFTGTSTIGNSQVFDNGTSVVIGGTSGVVKLQVLDSGNTFSAHFSGNNQTNGIAFGTSSGNDALIQGFTKTFSAYTNLHINKDGGNVIIGNNLGLGVTPSSWNSVFKVLESGDTNNQTAIAFQNNSNVIYLTTNSYFDTSWKYKFSDNAGQYLIDGNEHRWYNAPSGTAGNAISFTQAMTLDASGNLMLGGTTQLGKATIIGNNNDANSGQLVIAGSTSTNKRTSIGYNTTGDYGFISVYTALSGYNALALQPLGGNVGIGTNSPSDKLDVVGSIRVSSNNFFRYDGDTGLIGSATAITGGVNTQLGIRAANDILFATNGANERMRISSGGDVGIGTTSPTQKLEVTGDVNATSFNSTRGLVSVAPVTPTTFYTPSGAGIYIAHIFLGGNATQTWDATIMFMFNASNISIINQTNGVNVTTSVSGTNIQVTQIGGTTYSFNYDVIKIR